MRVGLAAAEGPRELRELPLAALVERRDGDLPATGRREAFVRREKRWR